MLRALSILVFLGVSGCATTERYSSFVADSYSKGDYFSGTLGLLFAPIAIPVQAFASLDSSERQAVTAAVAGAASASRPSQGLASSYYAPSPRSGAASFVESCVCGPDYIPCHERNARKNGEKYTTGRNESGPYIKTYGKDGLPAGLHTWKTGENRCGAQAY